MSLADILRCFARDPAEPAKPAPAPKTTPAPAPRPAPAPARVCETVRPVVQAPVRAPVRTEGHRFLCLDTETTGISHDDRICEIAILEFNERFEVTSQLHRYINPQRRMPYGAFRVHGLSDAFLADKPVFGDVADEIADFIRGSDIFIHNASFDTRMLNHEFGLLSRPSIDLLNTNIHCSLKYARSLYAGMPRPRPSCTLDALCTRYSISLESRAEHHGALIDTMLLLKLIERMKMPLV
ncbi:exonuclease domain-containing protein [Sutterella sp.]|uniref:exonuclease domain-containing protein n=1 Tax=Sutterella sp. TaxID=1981025 RepID=UPI0026DF93FA|nr:exonuclease domain-containing protein [Sutterella sp.]MDO5532235.1 exonuclease domain-containing protein [Sutterella sp.]